MSSAYKLVAAHGKLEHRSSQQDKEENMYEVVKIVVGIAFIALVAYSVYNAVKNKKGK